jgi:hydroxyacylglutathione hydrolase
VFFRQVLHTDLGCASYVIADTAAGVGAVVDPRFEIDEYLELGRRHGFAITHVIETHNHADHRSGRPRLVAATGATVRVHRRAEATYPHTPVEDGDEIVLGAVRLRVLHTPGHRPEHCAIVVIDGERSPDPCAVLTGDSLFVNDIARPDLAVEPREGASDLFDSMRRIVALGDEVEVYPGHTGGSLCGSARVSEKTSSTVGFERRHNPLLAIDDRERFVATLTAGLPPQPPDFARIADLNRVAESAETGDPVAVTGDRLAELVAAGAMVVDGRDAEDFDAGHTPGSVGVSVSVTGFGTKVAWLREAGGQLVLVGQDEAQQREMARLLDAIGITDVHAMLAGGFAGWRAAGLAVESAEVVDVPGLARLREDDPELQILDVRGGEEWAERRIPGSSHLPYQELVRRTPALDPGRPVAVICSSGTRSAVAVGLLQRAGFAHVIHVAHGGVDTWAALGYPVTAGDGAVPA